MTSKITEGNIKTKEHTPNTLSIVNDYHSSQKYNDHQDKRGSQKLDTLSWE